MNSQLLLAHFNKISYAPDPVPRLRKFVLDLAVRGKLVEQDPNDEPARLLMARVRGEKERLLKEGKIRHSEPRGAVSPSELEYPLPVNWEPARIGDLLTVIRGASPRPKGDPQYFSTERTQYHWIKISDIRKHSKDRVLFDTDEFLTADGMKKSVLLPKGTLIVTNSATIGVPVFLGFEGGCIHDGYLAFPYFPVSELSKDFFFILFQTLQSYATKKARGMAQLNLNTELVREFPLGLPPLAEQYRIVAKVDELMGLCDRLEITHHEQESRVTRLTAATHHHLNSGAGAEDLRNHAQFFIGHLTTLTSRPSQIKQLRQTLLNIAVSGKLVHQDSNDDSVVELLNRIRSGKRTDNKTGKSKPVESSSRTVSNAEPFAIPKNWRWVTLGELVESMANGIYKPSRFYSETGTACVRMYNIQNGHLDLSKLQRLELTPDEAEQYRLETTDILVNRVNSRELVGKAAIVNRLEEPMVFEAMNIRLRFIEKKHLPDYINLLLRTGRVRREFQEDAKQAVGQASISQPRVASIMVPLPPLAEQNRIVEKVKNLMALCDQLEFQLASSESNSSSLLESMLFNALNSAERRIAELVG
jgi:type I restriction enzyme S subunit